MTDLLDKFGLPTAFLVVIGLFSWKCVWPMVKEFVTASQKRSEQDQKRAEQAEEWLRQQIAQANLRHDETSKRFLEQLAKFTAINDHLQHTNDATVEELKRLANAVERFTK